MAETMKDFFAEFDIQQFDAVLFEGGDLGNIVVDVASLKTDDGGVAAGAFPGFKNHPESVVSILGTGIRSMLEQLADSASVEVLMTQVDKLSTILYHRPEDCLSVMIDTSVDLKMALLHYTEDHNDVFQFCIAWGSTASRQLLDWSKACAQTPQSSKVNFLN